MTRYWLFAGDEYYPRGGGDDLVSEHATLGEAIDAGRVCARDWWHVLDVELRSVIFRGERIRIGGGAYEYREPLFWWPPS